MTSLPTKPDGRAKRTKKVAFFSQAALMASYAAHLDPKPSPREPTHRALGTDADRGLPPHVLAGRLPCAAVPTHLFRVIRDLTSSWRAPALGTWTLAGAS